MNRFQEMTVFVAVVDAGSFVGAADALGLSRAAVSRLVGELESRLGVRLLHRTTRRLSLTDEGRIFHLRCKAVLAELDEAEAEVRVGFTYLVEEGYDMAVRIGRLASSSLIGRQLSSTRMVLCASPGYLAAHGAPRHPRDLADHAVISYSLFSMGEQWEFEGPDGAVSVKVEPRMRTNSGDTCRQAALHDSGIVLQPSFLVGEDVEAGRLVELMPEYRSIELGIYAVYASRQHVSPKVRLLIDHLQRALAGRRW